MAPLIWRVQDWLLGEVRSNPNAYKTFWVAGKGEHKKPMAWVDALAEDTFARKLHETFPRDKVLVLGEESLELEPNLETEQRICILVDMVDGTDLLERDFGNWCSAVVVYSPGRTIEAAYVAVRSSTRNTLYYSVSSEFPQKCHYDADQRKFVDASGVSGPTAAIQLEDAVVCAYAQKAFAVLNLYGMDSSSLKDWLERTKRTNSDMKRTAAGELGFRFYNLAGNPRGCQDFRVWGIP
jgi:hypothetical protein